MNDTAPRTESAQARSYLAVAGKIAASIAATMFLGWFGMVAQSTNDNTVRTREDVAALRVTTETNVANVARLEVRVDTLESHEWSRMNRTALR